MHNHCNQLFILGRVISAVDDYCPAVIRNLTKVRTLWQIMSRILSREEMMPWVSGFFFNNAVQLVLLFGAEMWVVNPCMGRFLGGFQDQVERRLTGHLPRRGLIVMWEYTSVESARDGEGFETMETYIR